MEHTLFRNQRAAKSKRRRSLCRPLQTNHHERPSQPPLHPARVPRVKSRPTAEIRAQVEKPPKVYDSLSLSLLRYPLLYFPKRWLLSACWIPGLFLVSFWACFLFLTPYFFFRETLLFSLAFSPRPVDIRIYNYRRYKKEEEPDPHQSRKYYPPFSRDQILFIFPMGLFLAGGQRHVRLSVSALICVPGLGIRN